MIVATSSTPSLFPYQQDTLRFIAEAEGNVIVGHETGVGKTPIAIRYCADNHLRTLVVCPASLKRQWQREIQRFAPDRVVCIVNGAPLPDVDFLITNYESLHRIATNTRLLLSLDAIVLDEAQYIKEYQPGKHGKKHAQSSQRAHLVHTLFQDVPHKLLLTGTAIKSRPVELWSLLHFLDPYRWPDPWAYGRRMGLIRSGYFGVDLKGEGDGLKVNADIKDVYIRYTKAEVRADMPPKLRSELTFDLRGTDLAQYRALEKAWLSLKFAHAHLAALARLRHWCADRKVAAIKEYVDTILNGGQKVVVFSSFRTTLDIAENEWPDAARIDGSCSLGQRDEAVRSFMADDGASVFLIQTQAGGVGLNLNHPDAQTCVFLDLPWTPADLMQAEDRIYRITNSNRIISVRPVFAGTVEEQVRALLARKEITLARVLEGRDSLTSEAETSVLDELVAHYREGEHGRQDRH